MSERPLWRRNPPALLLGTAALTSLALHFNWPSLGPILLACGVLALVGAIVNGEERR